MRGLDLRIEHGERVLLLGPSGSGKSTLLAALAGLLKDAEAGDAEGTLVVEGAVGIVFQDPESQIVLSTCGDDVAFGLENAGVPTAEIWPRVEEALAAVGFPYDRDRPTSALSGGEKQRLVIAGVLALRPGVLLLDEPTSNLDAQGAALVRETIRAIAARGDTTVVMIEHRVSEALDLVDRVVVLGAGEGVVADGAAAPLFASHGRALAEAGVWVPGDMPDAPPRAASPGGAMVRAEDVAFEYPGSPRRALTGVSALLESCSTLALLGANGSGKSTLALLLSGLLRPHAGRVVVRDGAVLAKMRPRELVRRSGHVFQNPEHQFVTERVDEELMVGPLRAGASGSSARRTAETLLERMRLGSLAAANPFTLSGGEKRRVSVATALATVPSALVLDEPTFGQDRRTFIELLRLLAEYRDAGGALCVATHDELLVRAMADRVLRLESGRLS